MYTLYSLAGTCSMAAHVLLNELQQSFTLEDVSVPAGQPRPAAYLKINPRGSVPTLVDDGNVIRENAAILMHLCEKHHSPLLPTSGIARTQAIEWLMFCNATLHPAYTRAFFGMRNLTGEAQQQFLSLAVNAINTLWKEVDTHLSTHAYLCGEKMTVADILITVIANWSGRFEGIQLGQHTKRLLKTISSLPAYQKALKAEKVEYKAA